MSRAHLVDLLNILAFALLVVGLWRTLFGPQEGESTWQALVRQARRPSASPLMLTKEQERFQRLPPEEQANYNRQMHAVATLTPANQGNVYEATSSVLNEIHIGTVNARWGASFLVLGAGCSLAATFL